MSRTPYLYVNRESILYIAYKACAGTDFGVWRKNPLQYRNAINLISINLFIHILELAILIRGLKPGTGKLTVVHLIVLAVTYLVLAFSVQLIFTKQVLARAIRKNKGSRLGTYSKPLAFGYLVINILLLSVILL